MIQTEPSQSLNKYIKYSAFSLEYRLLNEEVTKPESTPMEPLYSILLT